jgi:esterase/lipase superfamily enzyme
MKHRKLNPTGTVATLLMLVMTCGFIGGCGKKPTLLMTTPSIYAYPGWEPFADVPVELQTNQLDVLYVTDRVPDKVSPDHMDYGHKRSRSAAFGECTVQIGEDNFTWDELVKASTSKARDRDIPLTLESVREIGRFPETPPKLFLTDEEMNQGYANDEPEGPAAMQAFLTELRARLAQTPRKEVFMYVHGFNISFENAVLTGGEFWHFLGREGVPIVYAWPAGQGALRAYGYTEQSSLFTIHHLKQTIRLIASCPEVEKIHIVGHSRGTDVASRAVLELHLETRENGNTQEKFKFGKLVLAAPDMDIDVVSQALWAERISQALQTVVVYVHRHDRALSLSNWLTGGTTRLGDIDLEHYDPEEVKSVRGSERNQYIEAHVKKAGAFGHDYYRANGSVSSDLMLLLRYNLPAGGALGRPLGESDSGFWLLTDSYPGSSDTEWFQALRNRDAAPASFRDETKGLSDTGETPVIH